MAAERIDVWTCNSCGQPIDGTICIACGDRGGLSVGYVRADLNAKGDGMGLGELATEVCRLEDQLEEAAEEIVWLRAVLGRIAAGHAHAPKLAGEAIDESVARIPVP